ncbi:hypothetical protein ACFL13_01300 [Patescibacteria group bacterium]
MDWKGKIGEHHDGEEGRLAIEKEVEYEANLKKYRIRFRCPVCGVEPKGPRKGMLRPVPLNGAGTWTSLDNNKPSPITYWTSPPKGYWQCTSCKLWACPNCIYREICKTCAEKL